MQPSHYPLAGLGLFPVDARCRCAYPFIILPRLPPYLWFIYSTLHFTPRGLPDVPVTRAHTHPTLRCCPITRPFNPACRLHTAGLPRTLIYPTVVPCRTHSDTRFVRLTFALDRYYRALPRLPAGVDILVTGLGVAYHPDR